MACIDGPNQRTPQPQLPQFQPAVQEDRIPASFHRGRRPALIPPNCSLTLAEADDLVRSRIHQPIFPPPDPLFLKHMRSISPAQSESSDPDPGNRFDSSSKRPNRLEVYCASNPSSPLPSSIAKDARRQALWLKARAHYARDWTLGHRHSIDTGCDCPQSQNSRIKSLQRPRAPTSIQLPKRKHSAFVMDEELQCQLEDRVGTPHLSELVPGDDVNTQCHIEELRMNGDLVTRRLSRENSNDLNLIAEPKKSDTDAS
ncbi:hypothetical protein GQ43DRAFT_43327 [Delitschia confertaspora ATCC 74209]|uniref:Uncharacterized protein n=1 Tax=Delitschia confertaspora ATCC 74209 TaxID=1513339 RepID=A0A9P4JTZ7_9PLEO|nr:hypothetical protein GQ43DRAFT_43327 [Delitschia confertaspora ATCC 74209]